MNEPYDKNYVIAHLQLYGTRAKKSYGQNFLISYEVVKDIIDSLDIKEHDRCLEIGPGLGSLTYELNLKTDNLVLVELDKVLVAHLKNNYPNVEILNIDFLKYNFKKEKSPLKVIGNLPYGITSEIIEKLIYNNEKITQATLMVQKEAYDRIVAKKDNKEYGPLSILLEYLGGTRIIRNVSRHSFYPEPHVDSIVFQIIINKTTKIENEKVFFKFIKNMFLLRRKTILNNLTNFVRDRDIALSILQKVQINPQLRPENLSLKDYLTLYYALPQ